MPNDLPVLKSIWPELSAEGQDFAIATALLAYATGDAFGVAYEFEPLVTPPVPKIMLGKADWPSGGVSDDTLLSLMTIGCLSEATPEQAAQEFKLRLLKAKDQLRGLGPTTRHALGIFVEEREVGIIGVTNGGMMRTALTGLGFRGVNNLDRTKWVTSLCSATHFETEALFSALIMAEIYTSALELAEWNIDDAIATALANLEDVPSNIRLALGQAETFVTPEKGVSLNPVETLLAVSSIVRKSDTVWDAYEHSICAGGDTDTLAALSGALMALRNPGSFYELEFIADVNWQEIPEAGSAMQLLIENRDKK